MEAVVNKLGGMEGVENFLSSKTEVLPVLPSKDPVQRAERTFFGSYKSASALYRFLHGHDEYSSKDGLCCKYRASRLASRAYNISEAVIQKTGDSPLTEKIKEEMFDEIENILGSMREFKTRENFEIPCLGINEIKEGLRKNDYFLMLKGACRLGTSLWVAGQLNDLLLGKN